LLVGRDRPEGVGLLVAVGAQEFARAARQHGEKSRQDLRHGERQRRGQQPQPRHLLEKHQRQLAATAERSTDLR